MCGNGFKVVFCECVRAGMATSSESAAADYCTIVQYPYLRTSIEDDSTNDGREPLI